MCAGWGDPEEEEEEEEEERRASLLCCPQETLISLQQEQKEREGRICWESGGDLGKMQRASIHSLRAQHRTPCARARGQGAAGACEACRRSTDCANVCFPGEVASGGGVYILHRVWVSVHPHVHTPDAFASAMLHLTAPRGGFAEQPGQEAAQSESASSQSLLAPRSW